MDLVVFDLGGTLADSGAFEDALYARNNIDHRPSYPDFSNAESILDEPGLNG